VPLFSDNDGAERRAKRVRSVTGSTRKHHGVHWCHSGQLRCRKKGGQKACYWRGETLSAPTLALSSGLSPRYHILIFSASLFMMHTPVMNIGHQCILCSSCLAFILYKYLFLFVFLLNHLIMRHAAFLQKSAMSSKILLEYTPICSKIPHGYIYFAIIFRMRCTYIACNISTEGYYVERFPAGA